MKSAINNLIYLPRTFFAKRRGSPASADVKVRFLNLDDIPALMVLEQKKWNPDQSANETELRNRIMLYPQLSIGAFCTHTGEAMASLFMKPTQSETITQATNWQECVKVNEAGNKIPTSALFGISLSSTRLDAVKSIFEFFWPQALKAGIREIYLGSPVPGLRKWISANTGKCIESYIHDKRRKLPCDPQLRYYYKKGFRKIITVRPDYFPHEASMNYGVVIRAKVPLSELAPLWKRLPLPWLEMMRTLLFKIL